MPLASYTSQNILAGTLFPIPPAARTALYLGTESTHLLGQMENSLSGYVPIEEGYVCIEETHGADSSQKPLCVFKALVKASPSSPSSPLHGSIMMHARLQLVYSQ